MFIQCKYGAYRASETRSSIIDCTCGVGHEGTETNFVKSPPFVAHVLMSKKRRYFLSLKD